jgi:hypothetical protein
VALDGQGRVFVADFQSYAIKVFSPEGTLLGSWGSEGMQPGQFDLPVAVVLDGSGGAYVIDADGIPVQKVRLMPSLASVTQP